MNRGFFVAALAGFVLSVAGCSKSGSSTPHPGKAGQPSTKRADGTPIELQYVPEGFPFGMAVSQGSALQLFESPGGGQQFKQLPPETGGKRYYDEFTLAGRAHLVVTEEGPPLRMHFDENRNGNLTDDRGPFIAENQTFLPNNLSIQIRHDDEKVIVPYRMWLFTSNMGGVRFYPTCHWRGTLSLDGRDYPFIAFDGNADGDYSNDPIVLDQDGDGKAGGSETLRPGEAITLGSTTVKYIGISPSGLTARFNW